jgi:hypothetical protein
MDDTHRLGDSLRIGRRRLSELGSLLGSELQLRYLNPLQIR